MVAALALALVAAQAPAANGLDGLDRPEVALAYVLGEAPARPPAEPAPRGDGSLPAAVLRGLFAGYRLVLSSQDDAPCSFSPSCSAYSQRAIARHGFLEGLLLTADRLLRDHPLARGAYEVDPATGLLLDPVPSRGPAR